jgi:hypothetical protein
MWVKGPLNHDIIIGYIASNLAKIVCQSCSGTECGPDYKLKWTLWLSMCLSGYLCGSMMIGW